MDASTITGSVHFRKSGADEYDAIMPMKECKSVIHKSGHLLLSVRPILS